MLRITERPAALLAAGAGAALAAACAPAGLDGAVVPAWAWATWAAVFALALGTFAAAGVGPVQALRRLAWLPLPVAMLALPAALFAGPGRGPALAGALAARACSATAAAAAVAGALGPRGLVAGLAGLGLPARLVEVFAAALAGLSRVMRQVRAMLQARAVRRPGAGAWDAVLRSPRATLRGFGRLVAALLLRSLERAESQERARRARGVDA